MDAVDAGRRTPISGVRHFDDRRDLLLRRHHLQRHERAAQRDGAVRNGQVLIESYVPPTPSERSDEPIPWETSTLTAVTGRGWSWRRRGRDVASCRRAADRRTAAEAADKYAQWGKPPVYVVYLAGPSDGKTWFDGDLEHVDG